MTFKLGDKVKTGSVEIGPDEFKEAFVPEAELKALQAENVRLVAENCSLKEENEHLRLIDMKHDHELCMEGAKELRTEVGRLTTLLEKARTFVASDMERCLENWDTGGAGLAADFLDSINAALGVKE